MVDISNKPPIKRIATASGKIFLKTSTIERIQKGEILKGDPLVVGKVAALNAIKSTPQLIPLCHQIPITHVDFETKIAGDYIEVGVEVTTIAQTGVEMEAIMGVSIFLNNIWDMTKYLEKDAEGQYPSTRISDIHVIKKIKKS